MQSYSTHSAFPPMKQTVRGKRLRETERKKERLREKERETERKRKTD